MPRFNVTYEIVTPESAKHGDAEERGFIAENVSFREAVDLLFQTRTSHCDVGNGLEPNCSHRPARWWTMHNGMEYRTGAYENRSLHIPDNVTDASRERIAFLFTRH